MKRGIGKMLSIIIVIVGFIPMLIYVEIIKIRLFAYVLERMMHYTDSRDVEDEIFIKLCKECSLEEMPTYKKMIEIADRIMNEYIYDL